MTDNLPDNYNKPSEFLVPNSKTKLNLSEPLKDIVKIFKKNHLSYEQTQYLFKEARKSCELKKKRYHKGAKEHLSHEDFTRLINHVYQLSTIKGLMVKVLLFTGARVNEFVNIKIKDIYLSEKKIYLSTTKGDKPRYVPIFPFYIDELRMYIENNNNIYLFETRLHDKYTTRRVQQIIKGIIKECDIDKKITPHRLRATIAVWLKEKDISTEMIQQFLGHSKLETTQIYTQGAVMNLEAMGNKLLD